MTLHDRARAHLAKLRPAIAGQRGHAATFAAACCLVERGLRWEEAIALLAEWNQTHCQPAWTEGELFHKLRDAFKKCCVREEFTGARRVTDSRSGASQSVGSGRNPLKTTSASPQSEKLRSGLRYEPLSQNGQIDGMGEKPRSGCQLALSNLTLTAGNAAQFGALARLRGLSADAVALASERGLLRFCEYRQWPAWLILDASGRVAQARRLDGRNWFGDVKALNLTGSQAAWPVGIKEASPFRVVALCEGGPDLLAAFHFILREQRQADCAPVAMLGACPAIHPAALPLLAGKRVRIFGHDDAAGEKAVDRWAAQLADTDADVDSFRFSGLVRTDGQPVKDLNDLARIHPDHFEADRNVWTIFP